MYNNNKKKIKEYQKSHKKELRDYNHRYYLLHLEKMKEKTINWRRKNINYNKKYNSIYKVKIRIYKRKYTNRNRRENIYFKLLCNLRTRLNMSLRGNPKLSTTMKLTGCSIEYLKLHIQKKFTLGMTWENYGKWHIDHIKPCASFDLSKPGEQRKCFNYTNLQPLWAKDNLEKGAKDVR